MNGMSLITGLLISLIMLEVAIRVYRRVRHHKDFWETYPMASAKRLYFECHPYALYVKKPNCDGLYPTNSLGYAGKREISKERSPNSVRIYCVGGSTVETYDPDQGPDSTWPGKLQDLLISRFPGIAIECINGGVAGYTSAESLSDFLFRGVDLRPDILLVYHNVNDVWTCQMVEGFRSDYSHARTSNHWNVGWLNRIPQIPYLAIYQLLRYRIIRRFGKPNALIYWISDPPWKPVHAVDPNAVEAFRRNIINLVSVAQTWDCTSVLIKWECDWSAEYHPPYYLENTTETSRVYFDFLKANNQALEDISRRLENCHYLDVGPFGAHHFSDKVHFSVSGIDEIARRVADGIEPIVRSIVKAANSVRHNRDI